MKIGLAAGASFNLNSPQLEILNVSLWCALYLVLLAIIDYVFFFDYTQYCV